MQQRRAFVAGSTGAVGQRFVAEAHRRGLEVVAHQRPKPGRTAPPGSAVFELSDQAALHQALMGCTTIVQLIGTVRARFGEGDTYQTSDIGTTEQLLAAAAGTPVDHVVLLSSVGAGRPFGAYLKAKALVEAKVRESGWPYTIFRPSAFMGDRHRVVPGAKPLIHALGLRTLEPIALEDLAAALVHVAQARAPLAAVLEGAHPLERGRQGEGPRARFVRATRRRVEPSIRHAVHHSGSRPTGAGPRSPRAARSPRGRGARRPPSAAGRSRGGSAGSGRARCR